MSLPNEIKKEIQNITQKLMEKGITNDENFPCLIQKSGRESIVTWNLQSSVSISLKNIKFEDIYRKIIDEKNYNFLLFDGSVIQILYTFKSNELISHRLVYFPSPQYVIDQAELDNNENEDDDFYKDLRTEHASRFQIRFDYSLTGCKEMVHPKSHIHMGGCKDCRIPLSSPITPSLFIDFVLRNFYSKLFYSHSDLNFKFSNKFPRTITKNEAKIVHLNF